MIQVPGDVIRRLPLYLRALYDMSEKGEKRFSSGQISRRLRLPPSQFRQDVSWFGDFKTNALTYDVDTMLEELGKILGTYCEMSAVLVGPGKIGSALLENFDFIVKGYDVLGAFDRDPALIGKEIAGVPVYDSADLGTFVREKKVDIAILTVPRFSAQAITDTLVANGIKAIWNFSNIDLDIGDADVLVENVHFSDSLLTLNYYLAQKLEG